eukprot:2935403-Pyramimonas_sp.AAC.1
MLAEIGCHGVWRCVNAPPQAPSGRQELPSPRNEATQQSGIASSANRRFRIGEVRQIVPERGELPDSL